MERLKSMQECLIAAAQGQMGNLDKVDAKELGEVIDMIKDLEEAKKDCAEAKYYETIVKAMKKREEEEGKGEKGGKGEAHYHYYTIPYHDNHPYMV